MPQSGMVALKSFQSFMVNDGLLAKVVEAVKAGEKEARSTGDIQTFEVFYRGFRQNIAIGRVMVIPAKVADSRENFPIALLYGALVREFGGEEMADLINYKIGDSEFDEYSKADLAAIKDKVFKNKEGKFESVIMFAPSWMNKREYITFKFTKDDEQLTNLVRHLIFGAYFDPALSSAFNALMTDVSTDKLDVTNVTPKLNFPGIAENPLKDYPDMQKMGAGRKKVFLTKKTADAIQESVLEPAELDVFEELNKVVEKGLGVTESMEDVATHQACGELVVVQGTNVGPGTVAEDQAPPVVDDTKAPEGAESIGIELNADGTPKREEAGKEASKKTAEPAAGTAPAKAPAKGEETVLYNQQNGSDKEYRVLMTQGADGQWAVAAFNGRRGKATNPAQAFGPMSEVQARTKYNELIAAKTSGGYTRSLADQPKAPGQDNAQAVPARGQGSVIQFENATQVSLYEGMLVGQMSDGAWENSGPRDHWRPMAEADVRVGKPGMNFTPRRTYGFATLLQYVGDEMLALARATKAYPDVDWSNLAHAVEYIAQTPVDRMKEDWQKKYVEAVLKATGETDISQVAARINGQPYGMGELRKDLRSIQNVVNGQYHKDNDARYASMQKAARDLHETRQYKGHDFLLTTWQERDNLVIDLLDECCQKEILHLVDDDARSAIEDGFLNVKDMIGSAIDYAESMQLMTDFDDDNGPGGLSASSEHSRQAAKKHEEKLAASYESRKFADEVPTADNILSEVLSDIGLPPEVKLPGEGQSTTSEAENVPAPMKSEEPETTKEESAPEKDAAPFETKEAKPMVVTEKEMAPKPPQRSTPNPKDVKLPEGYKLKESKKASQKIADIMDLLEGNRHFGAGSRYGAAVAEDIAQAKGEVDFNKAEMADNADATKTVNPDHFADKTALYTEEGVLPKDTTEGAAAHYFQEPHPEVGGPMYECMDCRHVGMPNRTGRCEKCDSAAISKKIDTGAEAPSAKLVESTDKSAHGCGSKCEKCGEIHGGEHVCKKAGDQRKDEVPVVSEGKPSEDKKQPVSDLSAVAPEAHDVPAQVDSKTAAGEMSEGVDPALIDEINAQTDADETIDNPGAGMKYYQEPNGDFLSVDPATADYYNQIGRPGTMEGRATAIEGNIGSVCTTGVGTEFLESCKEVSRDQVPPEWLRMMEGEDEIHPTDAENDKALTEIENEGPIMASNEKVALGDPDEPIDMTDEHDIEMSQIAPPGEGYEVLVGNIGMVYSGPNEKEAQDVYNEYVNQSLSGGRGVGENVVLMHDGEIVQEHGEETWEGDPLENAPGYREHSNALDAQLEDEKEFDAPGKHRQNPTTEYVGGILCGNCEHTKDEHNAEGCSECDCTVYRRDTLEGNFNV